MGLPVEVCAVLCVVGFVLLYYGAGWLVKIRVSDTTPLDSLMDQSAYDAKHPVG